jgi:hypothetical protein
MAIQEADDSDPEDEDCSLLENATSEINFVSSHKGIRVREKRDIKWIGNLMKDDGRRKYYE